MATGLYLSRCRGRIGDTLDLDALATAFEGRAARVRVVDDVFDPGVQALIERDVFETPLDRVVIAGHSITFYTRSLAGALFRDQLVEMGLDPNHVVFANLLEQVALPHREDPEGAMAKAHTVVDVALLRAETLSESVPHRIEPARSVLVLGATAEGLLATQKLLQLAYEVVVADRGSVLERFDSLGAFDASRAYVISHPRATLIGGARLADGSGWVGDYDMVLEHGDETLELKVGGVLIADPGATAWVEELRAHFRVDVDDDGRARSLSPEAHPAETVEPGFAVVPVRAGQTPMHAVVAASDAAAIALVLKLSQPELHHHVQTSEVDEELCGGCASCVKTCAFGACYIDEETGLSHVDVRRCQACGKCVVSCPAGARDIISSPHDYMIEAIQRLSRMETEGERVIGFMCGGCGYPAGDNAGELIDRTERSGDGEHAYPSSFAPLWIPCGGRLDAQYVLEAYRAGFDGVSVFRCEEGHCHNRVGNVDMDRRVNLLRAVLRSRNLDDARLRIVDISPGDADRFTVAVNDFFDGIRTFDNGKGGPE